MSEYIIEWFGIGEQLTRLREGNVPFVLWPKRIREERRREEIVRCRDCIYYVQDPDPIDPGWPMMCERTGDDMVEPYGFCAWACRKSEE